jgi:hypothetical protein
MILKAREMTTLQNKQPVRTLPGQPFDPHVMYKPLAFAAQKEFNVIPPSDMTSCSW